MTNPARASERSFNPHSGVDLDSFAERLDQRNEMDFDAVAELEFAPPDVRQDTRRAPKRVANFPS